MVMANVGHATLCIRITLSHIRITLSRKGTVKILGIQFVFLNLPDQMTSFTVEFL